MEYDIQNWFYAAPIIVISVFFWAILARVVLDVSLYLLKIPARFFGLID